MRALLYRFATDQSGATSIEYGLIASGVALAIITVVTGLGTASIRNSKAFRRSSSSRGNRKRFDAALSVAAIANRFDAA